MLKVRLLGILMLFVGLLANANGAAIPDPVINEFTVAQVPGVAGTYTISGQVDNAPFLTVVHVTGVAGNFDITIYSCDGTFSKTVSVPPGTTGTVTGVAETPNERFSSPKSDLLL